VMAWLWPARTAAYGLFAAPGLLTSPTLMPPLIGAVFYGLVFLVCLGACFTTPPTEKEWSWRWFGDSSSKKKAEEQGGKYESLTALMLRLPRAFVVENFEKNLLPRIVFLTVYSIVNVVLFFEAYVRHANSEKGKALRGEAFLGCGTPTAPCASADDPAGVLVPANELMLLVGTGFWYPIAKGFGQLLNLNCTVMILPVVRSLFRWLHDVTSTNPAWYVAWIPYVIPLDKNIVFHKASAKYFIFTSVIGHAGAHYMNYSNAPLYSAALTPALYEASATVMAWDPFAPGAAPLNAGFSGEILSMVMLIIFSGAHDKVKRSHYETFWYTHHFFILWFVLLLFHGAVWKFWCIPALVPYVIDRLHRVFYRGRKPMALARVYFWGRPDRPDVITLQFDNAFSDKGRKPLTYMEGHYLYLRCPAVENSTLAPLKEWHPFTISSAPDEPVLEVNIRVLPSASAWTNKVARYLSMLDPNKTGEVELATRNATTGATTLGKVMGPDGRPFFMIDAPHGAPSQHVFAYNTSMLVGAGIGVTPCASIMKGVVNYRWKKGFSPRNLHFFWVARLTDLTTFKWLLVTLPELKAQQLVHNDYYGGDEAKRSQLKTRISQLAGEITADENGSKQPGPPAPLPAGWAESRTQNGQLYYFNAGTGETSWLPPGSGVPPASDSSAVKRAELQKLQAGFREASTNHRSLTITLYLTGAKPEQIKPQANPEKGSTAELVSALLSTVDPSTGQPYLHLKAGRPDWNREFQDLAALYGKEQIGVVFCGAPAIAAALKENCEKHSSTDGTRFKLHKENF